MGRQPSSLAILFAILFAQVVTGWRRAVGGATLALVMGCLAAGCSTSSTAVRYHAQISPELEANTPPELYRAMVRQVIRPDPEYDYQRLERISSLPLYPANYAERKNLVDKVEVYKSRHQMVLLKDGAQVRTYWIALSDRPQGDKIYQGDRRTPEGLYTLDYVKNDSYYYRAFHISYPNEQDRAEAARMGVDPGGMIMVHGQPPSNSVYEDTVQRSDWTNGCIAILNPEIDEFISLIDPGTPIEIMP